jgi:hypothetical protein
VSGACKKLRTLLFLDATWRGFVAGHCVSENHIDPVFKGQAVHKIV